MNFDFKLIEIEYKSSQVFVSFFVELSPDILLTNTALIYDGIMILAEALKQIGFEHLENSIEKISCYDTQSTWSKGYTITNYMKNVNSINSSQQ